MILLNSYQNNLFSGLWSGFLSRKALRSAVVWQWLKSLSSKFCFGSAKISCCMLTPTGEDVGMSQQGKITRDQFPHTSPMNSHRAGYLQRCLVKHMESLKAQQGYKGGRKTNLNFSSFLCILESSLILEPSGYDRDTYMYIPLWLMWGPRMWCHRSKFEKFGHEWKTPSRDCLRRFGYGATWCCF